MSFPALHLAMHAQLHESHAMFHPTHHTRQGQTPFLVFISFRVAEALAEARALKAEIVKMGHVAFVSQV